VPLDRGMRSTGFGSSELGALMGVDGYRDLHALWAEKKGGFDPPAPDLRMQLGKFLESGVAEFYSHFTKRRIEPMFDRTFRHSRFPHWLATPDALCLDESRGVDAKVAQWDQRHQWGETEDEIPERVQLQMHGCMAVMDRDCWDVALLMGDWLRVYTLERNREFEERLGRKIESVWAEYFEGDREPPPIGSSNISTLWLKQIYPKERKRPDIRPATDDEIKLLLDYGNLRAEQKALAATRARMENEIKLAIKDREGLEWGDGNRFTWRRTKDKTYVDWQSLAIALRTNFIKDEQERANVTELHTRKKEGVRRIYFKSDQFEEEEEAFNAA
jgi:predicted phage-related endonuclease